MRTICHEMLSHEMFKTLYCTMWSNKIRSFFEIYYFWVTDFLMPSMYWIDDFWENLVDTKLADNFVHVLVQKTERLVHFSTFSEYLHYSRKFACVCYVVTIERKLKEKSTCGVKEFVWFLFIPSSTQNKRQFQESLHIELPGLFLSARFHQILPWKQFFVQFNSIFLAEQGNSK